MSEHSPYTIKWPTVQLLTLVHDDLGHRYTHSALDMPRDPGLLQHAIHHPDLPHQEKWDCLEMCNLAVKYFAHISHTQPFPTGNLRTALALSLTFLASNHIHLTCTELDLFKIILDFDESEVSEEELANFFHEHVLDSVRICHWHTVEN